MFVAIFGVFFEAIWGAFESGSHSEELKENWKVNTGWCFESATSKSNTIRRKQSICSDVEYISSF